MRGYVGPEVWRERRETLLNRINGCVFRAKVVDKEARLPPAALPSSLLLGTLTGVGLSPALAAHNAEDYDAIPS